MALPAPIQSTLDILNAGSGWYARLEAQAGSDAAMAAALWDLIKVAPLPGAVEESCWRSMSRYGAYTADDMLALLRHGLQNTEMTSKGWESWLCTDWLRSLCTMVERVEAQADVLVKGLQTLAPLSQQFLTFALIAHGRLEQDQLDIPMDPFIAWIADGGSDRGWIFPVLPRVFGEKRWSEALAAAASANNSLTNYGQLYPIIPHLSPKAVVDLGGALASRPKKIVPLMLVAGPRILPELHARLSVASPGKGELSWDEDHRRKQRNLIQLACAQKLGGDIDNYAPLIAELAATHADSSWVITDVFETLPLEERERLILSTPKFHWQLAAVTPTPAVLQKAIATIVALPRSPYPHETDLIGPAFARLGGAAKGALLSALPGKANRLILLNLLFPHLDEQALPILITMLGDSLSDVRALATDWLGHLPAEIVQPALMEALKKKKTRLGAAQALALKPEWTHGVHKEIAAFRNAEQHPDVHIALSRALKPLPMPAPLVRFLDLVDSITPEQRAMLEPVLYGSQDRDWQMQVNRFIHGYASHGTLLFAFAMERIIWKQRHYLPSSCEWGVVSFHRKVDPEIVAWAYAWILQWKFMASNVTPSGLSYKPSEPMKDAFRWLMTYRDSRGRRAIYEAMVQGGIKAGPAYLRGLRAKDAKTRRACQDGLRLEPGAHTSELVMLLSHPTASVREAVAPLLKGNAAAQQALKDALSTEKNAKVSAALNAAL